VITIPAVEGITYTANGEEVTGDIEVPHDSITIEAHANDGYTITNDNTSWTYDYDPDEVTPQTPQRNDNTVEIPEIEGIDYTIDDEIVTGTITLDEDTIVVAKTKPGYTFDNDSTTSWQYTPYPVITPESPEHDGNTVIIPEVEGLVYSDTGTIDIPIDGLTITVSPEEHVLLTDDAITEWTFEYTPAVTSTESPTRDGNTVTIPDNEGIDYTVDGEKVEGELDIPEDGLIIEAEPQPGYSIDEDETTEWSYDYYPSVTPEEPTRDGNTVTIPDTDGIDYTRDNEIITGTIEIPEDGVNIVAIAKDG